MENSPTEQIVAAIRGANNVLVTVKNSPTVDDLAASIALTLIINKLGKRAVTVFSGRVPSTLEFLQPETAIDTNTDSLRDFIISLDKSKADKLRYKVEDNVVRIFITPYRNSITDKDLEFSQGDFNVDVVLALGVVEREDFDQAITAHGRILHDATVCTITTHEARSELGNVNWQDQQASSICEMIASISNQLGEDVLDSQVATALLTGIVSETDRFKNANTTPHVLSLSSTLMTAGANQQLIAEKLEAEVETDLDGPTQGIAPLDPETPQEPGSLQISHDHDETGEHEPLRDIHIDDAGNMKFHEEVAQEVVDAPKSTEGEPVSNIEPAPDTTEESSEVPPVVASEPASSHDDIQPPVTVDQPFASDMPQPDASPTQAVSPQEPVAIEQPAVVSQDVSAFTEAAPDAPVEPPVASAQTEQPPVVTVQPLEPQHEPEQSPLIQAIPNRQPILAPPSSGTPQTSQSGTAEPTDMFSVSTEGASNTQNAWLMPQAIPFNAQPSEHQERPMPNLAPIEPLTPDPTPEPAPQTEVPTPAAPPPVPPPIGSIGSVDSAPDSNPFLNPSAK